MAGSDARQTPAMKQYYRFKAEHPGCMLLFRMGDFYELFEDDAVTAHRVLGLTLTKRPPADMPLAGVPHHQLENYLRRLVNLGHRVAIADQVQDPKEAKGVVDRAVTRVVSSGTLVDEGLLDGEQVSRLGAVVLDEHADGLVASLAVIELSTGSFVLSTCRIGALADELARLGVKELLHIDARADGQPATAVAEAAARAACETTARPAWQFRPQEAFETVTRHFGVKTLAGFGMADDHPAIAAAGALIACLSETQVSTRDTRPGSLPASLAHLRPPRLDESNAGCVLDAASLRALEVEKTMRTGELAGSLLGTFLRAGKGSVCRTAMGKRLLRDWMCRPLADRAAIEARQAAVAMFVEDARTADALGELLDQVHDVARIAGRLALGRATPRDVVGLGRSLGVIDEVLELADGAPSLSAHSTALRALASDLGELAEAIAQACIDDPPAHLREGGLIRDGVDAELDESRRLQTDANSWLAEYQAKIAAELDLPTLKVGFNKVFGYYIELTAVQAREHDETLTKAAFTRKQTLKNAERYITPELKDFEGKVTTAEARAIEREQKLFAGLCARACEQLAAIGVFADTMAELDALAGLAAKAVQRGWTRPTIVDEPTLAIHGGRHPVLDETLETNFVPNDVELGVAGNAASRARLALLTGPNMAGKSTYIRQVALLTLLAHIGSFVPADRATIGVCDRICTRIGADDALHRGQSTFMVEMTETASILNSATERTLVILDEIGRGTSTLDGLSLAWAIAEHLAGNDETNSEAGGPRTLFATHYHELTELAERMAGRVTNLHVAVREWTAPDDADGHPEIIFLHRIMPGRADQSYGVQVARLAGVPGPVIARAREVLATLSVQGAGVDKPDVTNVPAARKPAPSDQMSLFTEFVPHPAVDAIREIKLDELSPMQAFDALRRLCDLAETDR
ncbi:MAG: DNA mismatch repair protein MutS [Planctomycetota bacterium]